MNQFYPLKNEFERYLQQKLPKSAKSYVSYVGSVFSEYLFEIYSPEEVDDICRKIEKGEVQAQKRLEDVVDLLQDKILNDWAHKKTYYNHRSGLRSYIDFFMWRLSPTDAKARCEKADTIRKFKARIRTQNRPICDSEIPCFPISFILWAAKSLDKSYWTIVNNAIAETAPNVHILTGNGVSHVGEIEYISIRKDGTMWINVEKKEYPIFSATAAGGVVQMKTSEMDIDKALQEKDLDHFTPIKEILKEHSADYPKLKELTQYMCSYAEDNDLLVKASSSSLKTLVQHMQKSNNVITALKNRNFFPELAKEVERILRATTFTLMDAVQNNKKGAGNKKNNNI